MGVKNFERLLITIPECILNPNQIDFGLGLSPGWGPKPNIYIFWVKCLLMANFC